jgi:hypothetical protein
LLTIEIATRHQASKKRENVMRSTILIGLTFFVLVSSAWAVELVRYHPQSDNGIDPLAPINITIALN